MRSTRSEQAGLVLDRQTVHCSRRDTDRYGRMVAVCIVSSASANAWLVEHGYAAAYRRYSKEYGRVEEAARAARRGLWAGQWQMPWEFRAKPSRAATRSEPRTQMLNPVHYRSCSEVRAAGAAPLVRGQTGYRSVLDGDGDGLACER